MCLVFVARSEEDAGDDAGDDHAEKEDSEDSSGKRLREVKRVLFQKPFNLAPRILNYFNISKPTNLLRIKQKGFI